MKFHPSLRPNSRTRRKEFVYEVIEPRKVLAALFPTYVDGQFTLGNANSSAPYALADTFKLETNPGASKTIYLDFDGHFSNNNSWDHSINFPAWNREGNSGSFSNAELIEIQRQFQNVAEDFAPFDVNVTTRDPGVAALTKSSFFDQNYGVRVVSTQATGGFGNGIGGVAYLRSFDDSIDNPVFVFNKGVNNGAMTISHEVGHALGLSHDGLNSNSYHPGSGFGETSWGPILGAPFGRNVTQWSKGDYAGSTQTQDDLAIITNASNGINYKADDVGNNIASATALEASGNQVFDWGIVERNTDVDYYRFSTTGGLVDLDIKAFEENPNLDIRIRLYDSSGNWVLANNNPDRVDALIQRTLPADTYYLAVDGIGKNGAYSSYGSLGFYSIEGTIAGLSGTSVTQEKIGEVGNIPNLFHNWKTIQFSQSYSNPVVVAGPSTTNGADPVTVRIRNVTSNSFQIRIDEWDYRDDRHSLERVDWMVVEAGDHTLPDGTRLKAFKTGSQNQAWSQQTFGGTFANSSQPPVVIASVTTVRENSAVTTRIRNVTNTGFLLRIQEEQAADQVHAGEEVSFIAIEKGVGQTGNSNFIVADTGRVVSHRSHTINFSPTFTSRPSFFAEMQSNWGGDPATVRMRNLVNHRAIVFLEEERSADSEVGHTTESVGYVAIPQGDILAQTSSAMNSPGSSSVFRSSVVGADGDLSDALAELESWGDVTFAYADHDHGDDNHEHGCGCGCAACRMASDAGSVQTKVQDFGLNIDISDEIQNRVPSFVQSNFDAFAERFGDSVSRNDSSQNRFLGWLDAIRQRHVDSFFEQNLGLLSNWLRK